MDVSIIIVNWNAIDYLRECLTSIYEHTKGISFEIIVVDNASTKGDVGFLKVLFPQIRIIKSDKNLGFAKANNLGFHHARGSYVLFLNPDTRLVNPAIDIMVGRSQTLADAGIIGCRQVNPDLTVQTTSIQTFPTILNQIFNIEYLRLRWRSCPLWNIEPLYRDCLEPVQVEVIPGACMLLRSQVFKEVGMFSEEYFMYAEDIDLNYKVTQAGYKNYYISEAMIIHYGGKSSAQRKTSQWSTIMKYSSMAKYYSKNYGKPYASVYRITMGLCALWRLGIITLIFPFVNRPQKRGSLLSAAQKWTAILKWSVGVADRV